MWKTFSNSCWPFTVENCQSSETENEDFFSSCWGVIQAFMCVLIQILPGPVFFFQPYSADNHSAKVKWFASAFSWRKHTNKQTKNKLTQPLSCVLQYNPSSVRLLQAASASKSKVPVLVAMKVTELIRNYCFKAINLDDTHMASHLNTHQN